MPRLHCALPLATGTSLALPAGAARHVQVLRLQPGQALTLFDGRGGEFDAVIEHMGRSDVQVLIGQHHDIEREASVPVHLVTGMPANERMDWLVEKITELGVQRLTPLMTERSVLRLQGERADKKLAHWQSVVVAASEQCGRNSLMHIDAPQTLTQWLARAETSTNPSMLRGVLSLSPQASALGHVRDQTPAGTAWLLVSGPEGGLSPSEESALLAHGLVPLSLGPRVLRAETAAMAAVTRLVMP